MQSQQNHKEPYPTEILPHRGYKNRLDIEELLSRYPDLLIVRQIGGVRNDCVIQTENGTEVLCSKIFQNNMANLSFNLAGGLFDTGSNAHLRFLPLGEAATPWSGENIRENICLDENSYKIVEPCFGLWFYVKSLHNTSFPFYRHFEDKSAWKDYKEKARVAITKRAERYDADFVGAFDETAKRAEVKNQLKVNHMPSKANYWHVTLDTYPPDKHDPIPSNHQSNQERVMFGVLKQHLVRLCVFDKMPTYEIAYKYYMKWHYSVFSTIRRLVKKTCLWKKSPRIPKE